MMVVRLLRDHPVAIGLAIRLILVFALPALMDDGLLLQGVRYTDIDYDVFTDAAVHVAHGRSPYERHTYRYTPFLADLLALPIGRHVSGFLGALLSVKYFGKILFCLADVMCGYIIVVLRRRGRRSAAGGAQTQKTRTGQGSKRGVINLLQSWLSPELKDGLWWLYNPLPINICTRGSAESLVVLLPVLATVAVTDAHQIQSPSSGTASFLQLIARACIAGIMHGVGIHAKLYPVIYTISFMANFSRQQQQQETMLREKDSTSSSTEGGYFGWRHNLSEENRKYLLSEQSIMQFNADCLCCDPKSLNSTSTFPWRHPMQAILLAIFWVQRLFFTMSSILFLVVSLATVGVLTYLAVHYHGHEALEEGLLYHFRRVDHRHNYSMYWYWIYLARGRAETIPSQLAGTAAVSSGSKLWGFIPLIPQILILGFSSLGIAPYDLSFALFCQTFAFVAFNKVVTAQYFTWYLCLLPLCSDRIDWYSRRMAGSLGLLLVSIVAWLLSAFTLEMLGWRSHRQVWMASLLFFVANVNLLRSILDGYKKRKQPGGYDQPGDGWARKVKAS